MNKAVLISIQPKWCELIASGKKTIEVRKTKPNLDVPFKVYIYCTKDKNHSFCTDDGNQYNHIGNGKVIGEFVCNGFTYIEAGYDTNGSKHLYNTAFLEHRMCIPDNELHKYLYKSKNNCGGWAWHISNVAIYHKPKDLSEFEIECKGGCDIPYVYYPPCENCRKNRLTRPPQSWCYVEELNHGSEDNKDA